VESVDDVFRNQHTAVTEEPGPGLSQSTRLFRIAWQQDNLDRWISSDELDCRNQQVLALWIVIVSVGCRWPHSDHDILSVDSELAHCGRIGPEKRNVNVFLDAGIFEYPVSSKVNSFVREHFRNHHPAQRWESNLVHKFIVEDRDRRNTQDRGEKRRRPRPMGECQGPLPTPNLTCQLTHPDAQSHGLCYLVLSAVSSK